MVTEVMAQPAEPIVSVAELPSGAPAKAGSCWPITGIVIELSASAPTWLETAAATAIAVVTSAVRSPRVGSRNFTNRKPLLEGGPNVGHLEAGVPYKQTKRVTQGGRTSGPDLRQADLWGNDWRRRQAVARV